MREEAMRNLSSYYSTSAAGQVGTLVGEIVAESARLRALIPYAPQQIKDLAQQTLDQMNILLDPEFIKVISIDESQYNRPEDRLLISTRRSEWLVWAANQVSTLRNLCNAIQSSVSGVAF